MTVSPFEALELSAIAILSSRLRELGYDCVTLHLSDGELFLDGFVPSYQAKREVEAQACLAGFLPRNRLRIAPGSTHSRITGDDSIAQTK